MTSRIIVTSSVTVLTLLRLADARGTSFDIICRIFVAFSFAVHANKLRHKSLPDSLRDPAVESERVSAGLENASICRRTLDK